MLDLKVGLQDGNGGALSAVEWKYVDNQILKYLRTRISGLKLLQTTKIAEGLMTHEYHKYKSTGDAILTYNFQTQHLVKVTKEITKASLIGIRVDMEVDKLVRDNSSNYISESVKIGMELVQQKIDRVIYRGTDILRDKLMSSLKGVTPTITGLINTAGVNEIAAGAAGAGTDDDMTAAGDYPVTVTKMINKLTEDNHFGPYALVVTPGCWSQMITNKNTTTGLTDLAEVMRIPRPELELSNGQNLPPAITKVFQSPHLLAAAETNATGDMILCDATPENMDLLVNYDPQRINYGGGLTARLTEQFALIAGLAPRIRRPTAICKTNTLINNVLSA